MDIYSVTSGSVSTAQSDGTRSFLQATPVAPSPVVPDTALVGIAVAQVQSPERVAQAVKQMNDALTQNGQNLHASIETDKATGISVVKFTDKITHEEVGQYPSKAIIAMAESIGQGMEKGLLMNVSA